MSRTISLTPLDEPAPFHRVAIVGFGLIGGSVGLAVKARWPSALVIAVDRKPVIEAAMRSLAADVGGDDLVLAAGADLVVLAAPVGVNIETLAALPGIIEGHAVVTDVGSTKRETVAAASALPERLPFVGGHPLSGAAVGGIEAARADLFAGRPWILTPTVGDAAHVGKLASWVEALGATVQQLTPDAHDRLVGVLSHLPQFTASALMHVVGQQAGPEALALAGRGLRDTTRLASSPASIWRDIARTNQDNIGPAIDALIGVLQELRADLDGRDGAIERTFDSAAAWKAALEQNFKAE